MVDSGSAETILKILSGVQAGIDVALLDGSYVLGSGDDDDIQLYDVSLLPGHARIVVGEGKVRLAGAAGPLTSGNGLVFEAGGELGEIEPLDILSAGTARFALGPRRANWASITQLGQVQPGEDGAPASRKLSSESRWFRPAIFAAAAGVLLLLAGGTWSSRIWHGPAQEALAVPTESELARVREALSRFPFGARLQVVQDVDDMIYVTGFVSNVAQRRAVLAAVTETGAPARTRLFVLDVMRNEISALLDSERAPFRFTLTDTGSLTVEGVMLDDARAAAIVETVREGVPGLASITSKVRTGSAILKDVGALAERSQISSYILLRLDRDLIEVSGILPSDKVDAWVGFLQAYSSQFASLVPLRSFVYLEGREAGGAAFPGTALFLGSGPGREGDTGVDLDRLRRGTYELSDIFPMGLARKPVTQQPGPVKPRHLDLEALLSAARGQQNPLGQEQSAYPWSGSAGASHEGGPGILPEGGQQLAQGAHGGSHPGLGPDGEISGQSLTGTGLSRLGSGPATGPDGTADDPAAFLRSASAMRGNSDAGMRGASDADTPAMGNDGGSGNGGADTRVNGEGGGPGNGGASAAGKDEARAEDGLTSLARRLVSSWLDGTLESTPEGAALVGSLRELQNRFSDSARAAGDLRMRYAPMLANRDIDAPQQACWKDSLLTRRNVAAVVFWLDLLSVSEEIALNDLDETFQAPILTAALNPERTRKCAEAEGDAVRSVYLHEIRKNPDFIRYIARGMNEFPMDIVGASIGNDAYVQIRSGSKLHEGSAPDESSRLLAIGELGVAVKREKSYFTRLFDSGMNWIVR